MENKITLSQSMVKELNSEGSCSAKFKARRIDNIPYPPELIAQLDLLNIKADARLKGCFFEFIALGNPNKDGVFVSDLPRLKDGKKSVDQIRIEAQAEFFKDKFLDYNNITISNRAVYHKIPYNKDIDLEMTSDIEGSIFDDNYNEERACIIDLKLTGNIHNQFGNFSWGNPYNMDHIQAIMYHHIVSEEIKMNLGTDNGKIIDLSFYYAIFDYKPKPEHILIEVKPTPIRKEEMKEAIRKAAEKVKINNEFGWSETPSYNNCIDCPLILTCKSANKKKPIIII